MGKERQVTALTSLRFFAAFWVVLFHHSNPSSSLFPLLNAAPEPVFNTIRTGYTAVGLFFVLSGFILAYTYRQDRVDARQFWLARASRIYPVYLLGLLVVAPFILHSVLWRQTSWLELAKGGLCLGLLQAWHPGVALSWNGPGWSLSAEAFFYLLFPFLLAPIRRFRRSQLLGAMALLWCVILFLPVLSVFSAVDGLSGVAATGLPPGGTWCDTIKFNPLIRLPEFVFGVMLGRLFVLEECHRGLNVRHHGRGGLFYLPALAILIVFCGVLSPYIPYPFLHNNALIIFQGLLIYGVAWGGGGLERILRMPLLVRLGQASYATYIIHIPLKAWLSLLDRHTFNLETTYPVPYFLLYVIALLGCSLAIYRWIEEPSRQLLRARFGRARREESQANFDENDSSHRGTDLPRKRVAA